MLRGGRHRYAEVNPKSGHRDDPSPLKVKQVWVEDERPYVVCVNEDQPTKERHDREAVVAEGTSRRHRLHVTTNVFRPPGVGNMSRA